MNKLVGSPTYAPKMSVEEILSVCAQADLRYFEIMTSWVHSAFDINKDPQHYLTLGQRFQIDYTSLHLPPIDDDMTLDNAVKAAQFAQELGVRVVIFKAKSIDLYLQTASRFLDAIDNLDLTTVITNHAGSPIATLEDYDRVLAGVDDPRLKALLEVGHFQVVGVSWGEACAALGDRIALVHIKDIREGQPVPYGSGEVDFAGLLRCLKQMGYTGEIVFELEKVPPEQIRQQLHEGLAYIRDLQAQIEEE